MELISVIIPTYNAEKTISGCIQSVQAQSYKNWELILVNDGSGDRSGEICDGFSAEDSRIRVFHQKNAGVSAARNLGLRQSKGDYVTFIDADDIIPADYLGILLQTCRGADVAVCDVVSLRDDRELHRFTLADQILERKEALNYLLERRRINSGPYAKLFRRETVEGLEFPALRAYEDILFVRDAFCRAERIAVTNRTEYRYIQNPEGAMSGFFKAPSPDIVTATHSNLEFLVQHRELSPEAFYITASHLMQYVQGTAARPEGRDFVRQAQKLYREYLAALWCCPAFPWKEKIIFTLFAWGWLYHDRRLTRIGG